METATTTIHVAIVEDDRSLREGLGLLINATPGFRCPRTFGSVGMLAAGFAYAWPQCLDRPEQINDELVRLWFSNVREAKPLYTQPWVTIATVISLPVVGVVGSGARGRYRLESARTRRG